MGWQNIGQSNQIAARNTSNTSEVNGELDATVPAQAGTYVLRDFVQTGDALRIKLPFLPSDKYPEYIWVENHQGRTQKGNQFDKFKFESDQPSCISKVVPGLYMYVQIDREHRTDNISGSNLYGGYEEFARPLSANGAWDEQWVTDPNTDGCVGPPPGIAFQRNSPNPLTGSSDTNWARYDTNVDGTLGGSENRLHWSEYDAGTNTFANQLYTNGHSRQAFTPSPGNSKLGVGTNPSSASMMSLRGYNPSPFNSSDLRRIYLNGVSVELLNQNTDGSIKIKVRFDDVDVNNDARWCADEIQLNPVATLTGYSLNVTAGKTVTVDQGTTATRRDAPATYNGQQIFVSPTVMRCPNNTWLNLAPGSNFVVDNGSTLRLENGSRMDIGNGAVLRVRRGGKLELMGGSVLNVWPGGQVIIEEGWQIGNDGHLVFFPNARINLEASNSVLEFAGILDIRDNATFTTSRTGDPNTTYGLVKFTNTDPTSYNVTAGTNTRFILRSTSNTNRILHVQQESLYGPSSLVEFSLKKGTATLADQARIVPPVTTTCSINFVNALVTSSTGVRNLHRGVRLNGQPNVVLNASTFSKGQVGIYSYNTTLGNGLSMLNCQFLDCDYGMRNYDKSLTASGCSYNINGIGLWCQQMSQTSNLVNCTAGGNAQTGVIVQGTATMNVTNPEFDYNGITGMEISHATAKVACGSVSHNGKDGFEVNQGGVLRMDAAGLGAHDPVTALLNGTTIHCIIAQNVYLDLGTNSLRPQVTGLQASLKGTFLCQPYGVQSAKYNNWNGTVGTALTSADYNITSCGTPVIFQDAQSNAETPCGSVHFAPPCPEPPCSEMESVLAYCPDCSTVETEAYGEVPLNEASAQAMAMGDDDSAPDNEKAAIDGLDQILANDLTDPNDDEKFLMGYDYALMKESYSDGLEKGQLVPEEGNAEMETYLGKLEVAQDRRIEAANEDQHEFVFYTMIEKAQMFRAAGKLTDALAILDGMELPSGETEQAVLAQVRCFTQIELAVRTGALQWDEVEAAMAACQGANGDTRSLATAQDGSGASDQAKILLVPNPAQDQVQVQGLGDAVYTLRLVDAMGRVVLKQGSVKEGSTIALGSVASGAYLYEVSTGTGAIQRGHLVVGR
ncbi:MAG: T9SS type A sorting domain-containing protein [Flavobacteriales bacterium]|nr:T9SS type A sorting domain-containing protein [Flavobacteriales bacterium]